MNDEYLDELKKLTLMSDAFASMVFEEPNIGMELLKPFQIMPEDAEICTYQTQREIRNFRKRSVTLDFLVETKKQVINIELENKKSRASPLRARYHASTLDVHVSKPKKKFKNLKEIIIMFICDFDYFGLGKSFYVVENKLKNEKNIVNDRIKYIYVNGKYEGDDEVGRLVHDLHCEKADDIYNEAIRKQVRFFKETEEGQEIMCEVMAKFEKIGEKRGQEKERLIILKQLMINLKVGVKEALKISGTPKKDWNKYERLLLE